MFVHLLSTPFAQAALTTFEVAAIFGIEFVSIQIFGKFIVNMWVGDLTVRHDGFWLALPVVVVDTILTLLFLVLVIVTFCSIYGIVIYH